jgi:NitT/TauT family transport system substrate-binding protein
VSTPRPCPTKTIADLKGQENYVTARRAVQPTRHGELCAVQGRSETVDVSIVCGAGNGAVAAMRSGQIDAINLTPDCCCSKHWRTKIVRTPASSRNPIRFCGLHASRLFVPRLKPSSTRTEHHAGFGHAIVRANKWIQVWVWPRSIRPFPRVISVGDRAVYIDAFGNQCASPDGLFPKMDQTVFNALASVDDKLARLNWIRRYSHQRSSLKKKPTPSTPKC